MINVSRKNLHLTDIFITDHYLELGNINYDVLVRLLNYEMVSYEDITYFPIQKQGIGSSELNSGLLSKNLPFVFFVNVNRKNRNLQLFITYGLLTIKDKNNHNVFSPVVLIPVNIYYENGKLFFQQISRPIENQVLVHFLKKTNKINIVTPDKLNKISDIDHYCFYISKIANAELHLENYLTFASIIPDKINIKHHDFQRFVAVKDYLHDKLFDRNEKDIFYITALNRLQRYAVHSVANGGNVVISGRHGTGKTTALINITVNAIHQGKRVLYVSNMEETLEQIYRYFKDHNLHQYLTKFYQSFASFHQRETIAAENEEVEAMDFTDLYENYQYVDKYQMAITNRILDYRYIEVVNELLLLSTVNYKQLPIDNLSSIYKAEFLDICKALETIQTSFSEIESFKDSIWKDIPIFNNIKYPNQIIALICQVQQCFKTLEKEKIILENNFGFQEISNYAYLKSIIHKFLNLSVDQVPISWFDSVAFDEIKEKYLELKNDIYQLQEEEYLFNIRYNKEKVDKLDLNVEINYLLGDFFNIDDLKPVNKILENRNDIVLKVKRAELQYDIYKKAINKIKYLLNWQFTVDNNILDEISRLEEVSKELEFNRKIISIIQKNRFSEVFNDARDLSNKIESGTTEINGFLRVFSKNSIKDLEKTITAFDNYRKDIPIKRSEYRLFSHLKEKDRGQYLRFIKIAKRFKELNKGIRDLQKRFFDLTGYEYNYDALYHMNYLNLYFCNIKNNMIRSKFAKFLLRVSDGKVNKNYRRTFALFSQSYVNLNNYYEYLNSFELTTGQSEFLLRIDEIKKADSYILDLFNSNDRLMIVHRNYNNDFVVAEDYIKLQNQINLISEKRIKLQEHKQYRKLFGRHYRESQTNINNLARLMQNFKLYTECFIDNDAMKKSLETEEYRQIKTHLAICQEEIDRLNEIFKLYFKIFRDGVSMYYYDDFKSNLAFLNKLINAKEELVTYLTITDNFAVLNNYKLSKLINYIINESSNQSIVGDFKFTYFSMLKEMHLREFPILADYHKLTDYLEKIQQREISKIKNVQKIVFNDIRKNSGSRFSVSGIRNLDYNGFIRRTEGIKHLFLSTSLAVNLFINVKLFDLVIIDDAHLLNAEEYGGALEGRQVVIAGEQQLQSAVTYNLIARIRSNRMIQFDYRFPPTPMNILSHISKLNGQFYNNFYDNFGIDVKGGNLPELIYNLINESDNCKINLFVSSIAKQRKLYDELAEYLLSKNYSDENIIELFSNLINVVCLSLSYVYDAEYNILYLEDYFDIDQEYLVFDMIDNMLLCRKRIIIYDPRDYLNQNIKSNFMKNLKHIVNNKFTFKKSFSSSLLQQIAEKLEKQKLIVYSSNEMSLLIRNKEKLYGVLLFWDLGKANFDILNDYRDLYFLNNSNKFKTIIIWSMEPSIDIIVERILEEIDNG